ncbi:MAG: NUDIX domain-containing protein [Candidatus Thorarchaeota archaeon]|jgi:ADP-ribose pyrophosphatase YjhB (NUDIX family)|nr:NUDIX domain-containing protein [Candidatus Thorarchaeota archaeon]
MMVPYVDNRRYPSHPIPGVGAVVVGPAGLLLVRRDKDPGKGLWSIPGGAVELAETQKEAVVREVMEETGVQCEVLELVSTADLVTLDSEGRIEYHYLLNHYLARGLTMETRPETPAAEVNWFPLDSLPLGEMPIRILDLLESVRERMLSLTSRD